MPAKRAGPGTDPKIIDEWSGGVSWLAHPDEAMQRASHAIRSGDDVWVVDPVDTQGLDELLARYGTIAGVVVLFNWHARDAGIVARRHNVPVFVPAWVNRVASRVDTRVERFDQELPGTGFRALRIVSHPLWREAALYREADGTLVVPDSVGTAPYFRAPGERLGVSPYQRLWPPGAVLGGLAPARILVGHGPGLYEAAADALLDALDGARRRAPRVVGAQLGTLLHNLAAAVRD